MSKKKKTMMDLIEQIGDDPRFRSTMEVLHSTSGPFSENAKKTEEARITDEQTNRPSDRQTVYTTSRLRLKTFLLFQSIKLAYSST